MKNDFQRHKKSDGIKWIAVTLAIILLATSVMAVITKGFKDWNPYGWFDNNAPVADPNGGVVDDSGNNMQSGTMYNLPKNMAFKSTSIMSADSAEGVNVKATIAPLTANNQKVDWTVAFVNPAATWATGKTANAYVTAVPTADGALTAVVRCLQAFGEQIKIVVTSRENVEIKAECSTDFLQKITKTNVKYLSGKTGASTPLTDLCSIQFDLNNSSSATQLVSYDYVTSTVYTKADTYTTTMASTWNDDYFKNVSGEGIKLSIRSAGSIVKDNNNLIAFTKIGFNSLFKCCIIVDAEPYLTYFQHPEAFNKLRTASAAYFTDPNHFIWSINVSTTGKYTSYEQTIRLRFDPTSMNVLVESIELDNSALEF